MSLNPRSTDVVSRKVIYQNQVRRSFGILARLNDRNNSAEDLLSNSRTRILYSNQSFSGQERKIVLRSPSRGESRG